MRKTEKGLEVTVVTKDQEKKNDEEKTSTIQEVDCLLWAIGRQPNTSGLNVAAMVTCFSCLTGHFIVAALQIISLLMSNIFNKAGIPLHQQFEIIREHD